MREDQVSIIIPAYNAEGSLKRCIDSALSQDLKPAQVIVINDGSTDDTAGVARDYGDRIIYFKQENAGQGAARNAGLRIADASFVAFLDADDYWLPDFLDTCVRFLLTHREAVAVNTGYILRKWRKDYVGPRSIENMDKKFPNGFMIGNLFEFWGAYDHVRTGTVVIRRNVIEKAGYQRADLRISQDLEYWGYIATFGGWGFIPKPLWVGDSFSFAARGGWIQKYRKRRKLCPTVEEWEARIVPRLRIEDRAGFQAVRGRVASSFALNMIIGGDDVSSRAIVLKYGHEMPDTWSTKMMIGALNRGIGRWRLSCTLIRLREGAKSFLIHFFPGVSDSSPLNPQEPNPQSCQFFPINR